MTAYDLAAVTFFLLVWIAFARTTDGARRFGRVSLTRAMNEHRSIWMKTALHRDLRMIDTAIVGGLQNGTAFFASTTIFAIGGCFAIIGASDEVLRFFNDLPLPIALGRAGFETKIVGLAAIFVYSFFKFGWSYRLFNYCSIMIGTIPMTADIPRDPAAADRTIERAARLNVLAGRHFNAGLRAIFFAMGYLGWLAGPLVFAVSTALVLAVLVRRQFFSEARKVILEGLNL